MRRILLLTCVFFSVSTFAGTFTKKTSPDGSAPSPVEYVEATPLDAFSQRSGPWPSTEISEETSISEVLSPLDSLGFISGVESRNEGSPGIFLRGSGSTARVLSLYDGVPLNFADGLGSNRLLMPREMISGTQIIKGPASLFYGGEAMSGAVQFLPRQIDRPLVRGEVGSFGQRGVLVAAPLVHGEKHHFQMSAFTENTDGNFPFKIERTGQEGERSGDNTYLMRATANGHHEFGATDVSERLIVAKEIGSTPDAVGGTFAPLSFNNWATLAGATIHHSVSDALDLNYRISETTVRNEYYSGTFSQTQSARTMNSFSVTQQTGFGELEYFADSIYNEHKSFGTDNQLKTAHELEVGTIARIPYENTWIIQPGVRYLAAYKKSIAAVGFLQDTEVQKVWMTASQGFRAPGYSFLYGSYPGSPPFQGNPDLKPESSTQYEVGFTKKSEKYSQEFWKKSTYGLSAYTIDYTDFFKSIVNSGGFSTYTNESTAHAQGVEFQFAYDWDVWDFDFNYAHLETQTSTGKPIAFSPRDQASLLLSYHFGPLILSLKDTQWGPYILNDFALNQIEFKGWNTLDFVVRTVAMTDWNVKGGVLNLFDSPRELSLGYPEPQRRFFVSVERLF